MMKNMNLGDIIHIVITIIQIHIIIGSLREGLIILDPLIKRVPNFTLPTMQEHALMSKGGGVKRSWCLDSGCSRHMIGNKSLFTSLRAIQEGGYVTYGDNAKSKIKGIGTVKCDDHVILTDVYLVEDCRFNLISISQLSDRGLTVTFRKDKCEIIDNGKPLFTCLRYKNIYKFYPSDVKNSEICLNVDLDDKWLWHRKLGHISMSTLSKLKTKRLVKGLPNIKFEKDMLCDACAKGKQTKTHFKSKDIVNTS